MWNKESACGLGDGVGTIGFVRSDRLLLEVS